ncbi:hypothetical protein J4206_06865 [Candidatus Woesearchaeota archaeon]|nr:hypothetical protein [Candidatus Woesearchaeota archaeon]
MGDIPTATLTVDYQAPRQTLELTVRTYDLEGTNPGIAKVSILEDDKVIHTDLEYLFSSTVKVTHTTPGTHTYKALITDKDGNTVRTQEIPVNFTGYTQDNLPTATLEASLQTCRRTTEFTIRQRDMFDNKGVEWVKLYEDGNLIYTDTNHFFSTQTKVTHSEPGTHEYFAEVKYKDGPIIRTSNMQVMYAGIEEKTLLPTAELSSVTAEAGQSVQLSVRWRDEYDQDTIQSIRILEDGKPILTKIDQIFLFQEKIIPTNYGPHNYQAEINFKNGPTITTNAVMVNFSGQAIDTAPRAEIYYYEKDNSLIVRGFDYDGDNNGITKIVLFRDGQPILTKDNPDLDTLTSQAVPPGEIGESNYHAEVTDKGGNTARSEDIRINFKSLEEVTRKAEKYTVVVDTEGRTFEQLKNRDNHDFSIPFPWMPLAIILVYGAIMGSIIKKRK